MAADVYGCRESDTFRSPNAGIPAEMGSEEAGGEVLPTIRGRAQQHG